MARKAALSSSRVCLIFINLCGILSSGLIKGHPHKHDVEVNLDHETHLYLHVLDEHHYVRHLRPAASANDSVLVDTYVAPLSLHDLDTSTGIFEMTLRLKMRWEDPRLQWNSSDHGGLMELAVPVAQLWTPNLSLFATSRGSYQILNGKHAVLRLDGVVVWQYDVKVRSMCPMDLSNFPFDTQTCEMVFESGTSADESTHVHINNPSAGFMKGVARGHVSASMTGEWELLGEEVSVTTSEHSVRLRVRLGRRWRVYQCVVVSPLVLLALLVPAVFLLPAHSTAKVTFGGLLQVSMCICLRTLCDLLHHNHGSLPSIVVFGTASLALSSVSVMMAAVVVSLAHRGPTTRPVPAWLSRTILGRYGLRRWLCMDQPQAADRLPAFSTLKDAPDPLEADAASLKETDPSSDPKDHGMGLRTSLSRHSTDQLLQPGRGRTEGGEWMEIARVTDRLLFVLFVVLFMLTSVSLLS